MTSTPDLRHMALLPLGALAAGMALAQTPAAEPAVLPPTTVKASPAPADKDNVQATTTRIGKGEQALRDVAQSVTVVTERLMDDRQLDTVKDALRQTAGISFLAAEGSEEDIRLRGFALQSTGDVFVDGMRDAAFYDRDTFFLDRVEVLRGSASMLFGRGSTGGAVNQVTKAPFLMNQSNVAVTLGSGGLRRGVGDFNLVLGSNSAVRMGVMNTVADNDGTGSSLNKSGMAIAYRWGIGETDEISASVYRLQNDNGMNYGLPWIRPTHTADLSTTTMLPLPSDAYYGMASDVNAGSATLLTLGHTHRFSHDVELTTRLRHGRYERDQRASTIRLCGPRTNLPSTPGAPVTYTPSALCPERLVPMSLADFGPDTKLTRGSQLKIQDLQTTALQSDLSARFNALGLRHELLAGLDAAVETKTVYAARSSAQGGVTLTKPLTTVGAPDDGAWVDEASRVLRESSHYRARNLGVYVQDLIQVAEHWKVLAGLRWDKLSGDYDTYAIPTTAPGPVTTSTYQMNVAEWSQRLGLLYQPSEQWSLHASGATSFNTSGDAYSLTSANKDIPPEKAINLEVGANWASVDGRFSARMAAFRSTKLHERNTDPLVTDLVTLSGKRHVAGFEVDLAGRLTPGWEVFASYMWLPVAKIDKAATCIPGSPCLQTEQEGSRPSLTPRHSGSLWTTYQLTPAWRVGAGLNARSSQTPNRNPGWAAPRFVTGELMVEWAVIPEQFKLQANLSNVTDKRYADALYSGHYIPGAARRLDVTGTWRF
ncbi:MAG: TonB-dependent siderophore receptor [Proteobacteria bacterium]|nr:TonB-dependent siderophore receptor [Pseudomonadota bacterium]